MSNFWKSILLVWMPVTFIFSVVHRVFWGPLDLSSFYSGALVVIVAQVLDFIFGLDRPRRSN